jgi:hypothetical protein
MVKKRTTRCSVRNAMAKEEDAFAGAGGPSRSDPIREGIARVQEVREPGQYVSTIDDPDQG